MILDAIRHTVTCPVCGFARGVPGVRLACCCRGWVALWREILAARAAKRQVSS